MIFYSTRILEVVVMEWLPVYPYLPKDRKISYVGEKNLYMAMAKECALKYGNKNMPVGAVIVNYGINIGRGANGSEYHEEHGCRRIELQCKSGEGYELCPGCDPKNHAEIKAIEAARVYAPRDLAGADLFLWGHWWCCKSCWDAMIKAGIRNVYLLDRSWILFNKEHPDNIIGQQFEI